MLKQNVLAKACAVALMAPWMQWAAADVCIGQVFNHEGVVLEGVPPSVSIQRVEYMPLLSAGQRVLLQAVTESGLPIIWCAPVGQFVAVAGDLTQVEYIAPETINADEVIRVFVHADKEGRVNGDNLYVQLSKSDASSNYSISGTLLDANGNPLAGVTVSIGGQSAVTDANGHYQISGLAAGTYALNVSGGDYPPVSVSVGAGNPVVDIGALRPQLDMYLIVTKGTGHNEVVIYNAATLQEIARFDAGFSGGVLNVRSVDWDGDGIRESIAVAQGQGGKEISVLAMDGTPLRPPIPVDANGVHFDADDMDGDGMPDFVVALNSSNRNSVDVYLSSQNWVKGATAQLFEQNTRISPALGDVNGDGQADIIGGDAQGKNGNVVAVVFANSQRVVFPVFNNEDERSGRKSDDDRGNSCTHTGNGVPPHCEEEDNATGDEDNQDAQQDGETPDNTVANNPRYGVNVFASDINCDGKAEIIAVMADKGSRGEVYSFENGVAKLVQKFDAFQDKGGVVVTAGDITQDGIAEIIVGQAQGNLLTGFDAQGNRLGELSTRTDDPIGSLAITGDGACSTQAIPAATVEEVNQIFAESGSQWLASQKDGLIEVRHLSSGEVLHYRHASHRADRMPAGTPSGLYRINADDDYILVEKSGKQKVFTPEK